MKALHLTALLFLFQPRAHASLCTNSTASKPNSLDSKKSRITKALELARFMGFRVKTRQSSIDDIYKELDEFTKAPQSFAFERRPDDFHNPLWDDLIGPLNKKIRTKFQKSAEKQFTSFSDFSQTQYRKLFMEAAPEMLQILRTRLVQGFGWHEYYGAWEQIQSIQNPLNAYRGLVAFDIGSSPDVLIIKGKSWDHRDPIDFIKTLTNKEFDVLNVNFKVRTSPHNPAVKKMTYQVEIRLPSI